MTTGTVGLGLGRMARRLARAMRRFAAREEGASLIEYGMLLILVALLCLLAIRAVGSKVSNAYNQANTLLP